MVKPDDGRALSSLSYQILLSFEWWFFIVYTAAELVLIIFKGVTFPYPVGNLASEILLLLFLSAVEYMRNFFGKKGNLTERILTVAISLLLTIPVIIGVVYFLTWQTYVLRIEVILSTILLVLLGVQSLFAGFSLMSFIRIAVR